MHIPCAYFAIVTMGFTDDTLDIVCAVVVLHETVKCWATALSLTVVFWIVANDDLNGGVEITFESSVYNYQ